MAETSKILEGVFAVSKPPSLSSAQVIRDIQQHFTTSKTFAPLLASMHDRFDSEDRRHAKRRRRDADSMFKIGHGGTLDPLATGVLIIGIGRGTKHLANFLGCTKQYDTVVLFGKSTDTYDVMGKIVSEAPFSQITEEKVAEKLDQFRGHIKQVPPVYSALKINGIKAYDYARTGKELPRQLESRDMEVTECRLIEYLVGGQHDFRWPSQEAPNEEKRAVAKLMKSAEATSGSQTNSPGLSVEEAKKDETVEPKEDIAEPEQSTKSGEQPPTEPADQVKPPSEQAQEEPTQTSNQENTNTTTNTATTTTSEFKLDPRDNNLAPEVKAALHTHNVPTLSSEPAPSPAARFSLTVSSGFYVRSFAHDLGIALGSHGIMAELIRSRQGDFVIPEVASQFPQLTPTLTYVDFEAGEETWGPKITGILEKWMVDNPLPGQIDADGNIRPDDRDRDRDRDRGSRKYFHKNRGWRGKGQSGGNWRGGQRRQPSD